MFHYVLILQSILAMDILCNASNDRNTKKNVIEFSHYAQLLSITENTNVSDYSTKIFKTYP